MHTALPRKVRHRKPMNSKGVSSIVGAIFMMLIVGTLASAYFFSTLNENTVYNQAVKDQNNFDLTRLSEALQVSNTVYSTDSGVITVSTEIFNIGSYAVNISTLWLKVTGDVDNVNFTKVNTIISAGDTLQLNAQLRLDGVVSGGNYYFASWLVSNRGNTFALESLRTNNIVVAQTTQGIGSLAMDFQNFTYYQVKPVSGSTYKVDFSTGTNAYNVLQAKAPLAFCVNFTNLDSKARDIVLNQNSELFSIFPSTGGNYKAVTWFIIKVDPVTGNIQSFNGQSLNYTVPTLVYFAARTPSATDNFVATNDMFTGTCPVNLALTGTIGTSPFGQNIPFVSIYIS